MVNLNINLDCTINENGQYIHGYDIDLSKRTKHNALLDCELLREVYINLLDVKEPKFNLASGSISGYSRLNNEYNKDVKNISELEIRLHKDFLKKELKKNFY